VKKTASEGKGGKEILGQKKDREGRRENLRSGERQWMERDGQGRRE